MNTPDLKWLGKSLQGNEYTQALNAITLTVPVGSVNPDDVNAVRAATESVIRKLQSMKKEWLKLTEDSWHDGCPKYMGIFNLVKREGTPVGKGRSTRVSKSDNTVSE